MTIDDWLLDLDPMRRRRRLRAEADPETEPPKRKTVDADQGALGVPPAGTPRRSPDSWLMEITDAARGEHSGDSRHYDTLYGD